MPQKFVSHSHKDNSLVVPFVEDLRNAGLDVWVDLEQIDHDDFIKRMNQGLAASDWVLLVQTPNSLPARSTAVEMEINAALAKKLRGELRDAIPFIMAPCDANEVPDIWQALHHYDAVRDGYARALTGLLRALGVTSGPQTISPVLAALLPGVGQATPSPLPQPSVSQGEPIPILTRLRNLGYQVRRITGVEVILPPTVPVPAGEFLMGSNTTQDMEAYDDELPQYAIEVAAFEMATYPVTVVEYAKYLAANSQVPIPPDVTFPDNAWINKDWRKKTLTWTIQQHQRADHPVVLVTWTNARDYAAWLAKMTGEPWRLPTEAEWEKAARGTDGRIYPWGPKWERGRANIFEDDGSPGMTTPIGLYAASDTTPYGCHDMIGNVWEWCHSILLPYPYDKYKCEDTIEITTTHIMRGGSWYNLSSLARAACRGGDEVDLCATVCGFRVVRGVGAGSH